MRLAQRPPLTHSYLRHQGVYAKKNVIPIMKYNFKHAPYHKMTHYEDDGENMKSSLGPTKRTNVKVVDFDRS